MVDIHHIMIRKKDNYAAEEMADTNIANFGSCVLNHRERDLRQKLIVSRHRRTW